MENKEIISWNSDGEHRRCLRCNETITGGQDQDGIPCCVSCYNAYIMQNRNLLTNKTEILNCPFCGGPATITHKTFKGILNRCKGIGYWGNSDTTRTLYWVGCDSKNDCFHPKTYGDKQEAINMWNERK